MNPPSITLSPEERLLMNSMSSGLHTILSPEAAARLVGRFHSLYALLLGIDATLAGVDAEAYAPLRARIASTLSPFTEEEEEEEAVPVPKNPERKEKKKEGAVILSFPSIKKPSLDTAEKRE